MILQTIKNNILFSRFCNGRIGSKNPEKDIERLEKILFLLNATSIESGKRSLFKGYLYVYKDKVSIPYISDLLRVCPNFLIYYSSLEYLVSERYTDDFKIIKKKTTEELDAEIKQYVEKNKDNLKIKFSEYKSIWYRKYARLNSRQNDHPFWCAMKTTFISLPCVLLPLIAMLVLYFSLYNPEYFNGLTHIVWIAIIEFFLMVIWVMITKVQTKPTGFEKKHGYDKF